MLEAHLASQHFKWEVRPPALTLGVRALQPQLSSPHRQDGAGGLPTSEKLHFSSHREMEC